MLLSAREELHFSMMEYMSSKWKRETRPHFTDYDIVFNLRKSGLETTISNSLSLRICEILKWAVGDLHVRLERVNCDHEGDSRIIEPEPTFLTDFRLFLTQWVCVDSVET